jgi:heterodisulfide reductase subunit C
METHLADWLRDTPDGIEAESILRSCVHCGFCTATCPTYQLLGDELDGPRGRIYLIKQVVEGVTPTRETQQHLDRCLTCRNCESTCPSGVQYGHLVDIGRKLVDQQVERPAGDRLLRGALREGMTRRGLFDTAMRLGQTVRPLLPEALKAKVKADLERGAKNRVETEAREELLKALIEKNPFECPASMIDRGVDFMLDGALQSLMRSGVDPRMLNLDWGKLRSEMRPRAEVEVRGSMLLEALGKTENLMATEADLDAKYEEISKETGMPAAQVKARYVAPEAQETLKTRIVEEKAMALVRQHATWS